MDCANAVSYYRNSEVLSVPVSVHAERLRHSVWPKVCSPSPCPSLNPPLVIEDKIPNYLPNRLQELYLKLAFLVSTSDSLDESLPDIMGMTSGAKASKAAVAVQKQIASIGAFVCDGAGAQAFENGILSYARDVVEQDLRFLELIRKDVCTGLNAFDLVKQPTSAGPQAEKLVRS